MHAQSPIERRDRTIAYLREQIQRASGQILLTLPASTLPAVAADLARARASGVLVAALFYGGEASVREKIDYELTEIASIARVWDVERGFSIFVADHAAGMMVPNRLLVDPEADEHGVVFGDERLYHLAYAWFMAHPWGMGRECAIADPDGLPATFEDFRKATFQATLWLRQRRRIRVRATAKPAGTDGPFQEVTGQLLSTRQQFLYPKLSSMFGETTILVRTDDGRVSMGGLDAYLEDYEARTVTLEPLDEP